jgi:hypothetical protein
MAQARPELPDLLDSTTLSPQEAQFLLVAGHFPSIQPQTRRPAHEESGLALIFRGRPVGHDQYIR